MISCGKKKNNIKHQQLSLRENNAEDNTPIQTNQLQKNWVEQYNFGTIYQRLHTVFNVSYTKGRRSCWILAALFNKKKRFTH